MRILPGAPMKKLIFIMCMILSSCDMKDPCSNHEKPRDELGVRNLGEVVLGDEKCQVDEIFEVHWNQGYNSNYNVDIDVEHNCIMSWRADGKIVARKITCPSGNNSVNSITNDGTKFHREVIH